MLRSSLRSKVISASANILLAALVFPSATAVAGGDPKQESRKLMTRSELRECIIREVELIKRRNALRDAQDGHNAIVAGLSDEAKALSDTLRSIDQSNEAAVNEFNRRIDDRDRRVELANQRADALNGAADAQRTAEADYMAECAARPYIRKDESTVLKELRMERRPSDNRQNKAPAKPTKQKPVPCGAGCA